MALQFSNRAKLRGLQAMFGVERGPEPLEILLVQAGYVFNADHSVVSDVSASEVSVGGYARQPVTINTITQQDASDRAEVDLATVDFGILPPGQTLHGAWLYRNPAGATADSERELVAFVEGDDVVLNGTTVRVLWTAPAGFLS